MSSSSNASVDHRSHVDSVLFLHGFGDNASNSSKLMQPLALQLADLLCFDFIDAPHPFSPLPLPPPTSSSSSSKSAGGIDHDAAPSPTPPPPPPPGPPPPILSEYDTDAPPLPLGPPPTVPGPSFQWFSPLLFAHSAPPSPPPSLLTELDASLTDLHHRLLQCRSATLVMSFSQGSFVTALYVTRLSTGKLSPVPPQLKGAVLIGSGEFAAGGELQMEVAAMKGRKPVVPIMFIFGRRDPLISPIRSRRVASYFASSSVYAHEGGHEVPTDDKVAAAIRMFVSQIESDRETHIMHMH